VGAAKTADGRLGVAYVPTATTVTVNIGAMTLPITARWFDPTNGTYKVIKTYTTAERPELKTPGPNSAGDSDWVLILEP
jgi:hypothetical protein